MQAVSTESGMPPVLYGLPKDHKQVSPGQEPPLRPVCGANCGPASRLGNVLASLITPCNDSLSYESWVESTEDLQSKIEEFNGLDVSMRENCEVFSMDVRALYPSLGVERTAEAVEEIFSESGVVFKNIDDTELSRYVALVCSEDAIVGRGLSEVVMTRKKSGGRKPAVTGNEMKRRWRDLEESLWNAPSREPTQDEVKKLLALAVRTDIEHMMKNNLFKFNGTMYIQSEGGMIGSELICLGLCG